MTRAGLAAFCEAFSAATTSAAGEAFDRWKTLFGGACGRDQAAASPQLSRWAAGLGIAAAARQPHLGLFALQSLYALLVKLVLARVVAVCRECPDPVARLLRAAGGDRLRAEIEQLEAECVLRTPAGPDDLRHDLFSWYLVAWSPGLQRLIRQIAAILALDDPRAWARCVAEGGDLLDELYRQLVPRAVRHELGEYYTPPWLAEHVLDQLEYAGDVDRRLLDPACGSGAFLAAAIRRIRARHAGAGRQMSEAALCREILANVAGYDVNPVAILAARANYLMALGPLLREGHEAVPPVLWCDSILGSPSPTDRPHEQFDYVAGNPPWVAWDNLTPEYREATKPLWQHYGLFSLSAKSARHGGGKKDLAMLMLYVAADRYLRHGGRLGMVVTQTVFQTKHAGDGFRRFRLGPQGVPLRVLRVDDMVAIRPFREAGNWTATIVLEKGRATEYPVPYTKWYPGARRLYGAEPIQPDEPGSPWLLRPEGLRAPQSALIGPSDYVAHLGANTGGANEVYWLRVLGQADGGVMVRSVVQATRRSVAAPPQVPSKPAEQLVFASCATDSSEAVQHCLRASSGTQVPMPVCLEPDLLYPLLRWGDVGRWRAVPSAAILLVQDPQRRTGIEAEVLERRYPQTWRYLRGFQRQLTLRAAYRRYQHGRPFYSMYDVGPYTLAPIKVVWRRMDRQMRAAVVEPVVDPLLGRRPVVPQETCVLVAVESAAEAHYLCAVLNSAVVNFLVAAHSVAGGKGFGTPGLLQFIRVRRFQPADRRHQGLAELSRCAHAAAAQGQDLEETQRAIDQQTADLWGLEPSELAAIHRELPGVV